MSDVAMQIEEARARWAARQAEFATAEARNAEETRSKALSLLSLPVWALEYVGEIKTRADQFVVNLHLPGCSPIRLTVWDWGTLCNYSVMEPLAVAHTDEVGWGVSAAERMLYGPASLDEAIDLASSFGESWHAMQADADRRNAEGLKPPPAEPTAWQAAQEALAYARLAYENPLFSHQEITLSAVFAIVEQLNLLNETLMKRDR